MSFQIIIKTIKNHDYAYVYWSYKDKSQKPAVSRKKFIRYLGSVNARRVQKDIEDFKAGRRKFFKRARRRRAPKIELETAQGLDLHEKAFIVTAIILQERGGAAPLKDVLELTREYCEHAQIKQPPSWDMTVDYFSKILGWLDVTAGKVKFLMSKKKRGEIKRVIAKAPEIKGRELMNGDKEQVKKAMIDF